jgi:hypothetical protein
VLRAVTCLKVQPFTFFGGGGSDSNSRNNTPP